MIKEFNSMAFQILKYNSVILSNFGDQKVIMKTILKDKRYCKNTIKIV